MSGAAGPIRFPGAADGLIVTVFSAPISILGREHFD
jgi:hypothetical protein